jgi:hypothetical protein
MRFDLVQQPFFDLDLLKFLQDTFEEQRAMKALTTTTVASTGALQSASDLGLEPGSQLPRNSTFEDLLMD